MFWRKQLENLKESDLYQPIKEYLDSLGYDTKGEVMDCDITAVKNNELIVVELKTGFTMELIYQGMQRQSIADSVYVAIPLPKRGYNAPRYHEMIRLCKRLELGLIFVGFTTKNKAQIDVAVHPQEAKPVRKNNKKRKAILKEHNERTGSVNTGGVTRRKIMTVYKEQCMQVSKILKQHGKLKVEEIRDFGGPEKTSSIIGRNFYKWYEKVDDLGNKNNSYILTDKGLLALEEYRDLIE